MINDPHDVYKDEEVVDVRMRAKDYKILMTIIERERSMGIVWKYVITILTGLTAIGGLVKMGFIKFGGS